ncbi:Uncharacterized protein JA1_002302 [Spathaspora sp. JA1]|nr:Uncharacterized protein JA1_002302 [Spathaspora sp. JA1]
MNLQQNDANKSKSPTPPSSQIDEQPQTAITLKDNTISTQENIEHNNVSVSGVSTSVNSEQTSRFSTLLFWNQQKLQVKEEEAIVDEEEGNTAIEDTQPENEPEPVPQETVSNGIIDQPRDTIEEPNNETVNTGWWGVPYGSINNFVSYVSSTVTSTPNEQTPLVQQSQEQSNNSTGWWNWSWNKPPTDEDDYDRAHTSNLELYKSAKTAIESSKEVCHYAFKSSFTNHIHTHTKEVELSVFGTLTENQPVQYHSRKQPLFPNEIQEKSLRTRPGSSSASSIIEGSSNITINKVAPNFQDNYRTITTKTKLRIISQDVLCGVPPESHLYKLKQSNIIHKKQKELTKIVIIGIHSFLPTKMVRALIGQNTGNSMRFVNHASTAMLKWLSQDCGVSFNLDSYDIETIALEGAGKVNDRVEVLYKLLGNWVDTIQKADVVFMASHGCSTPIAINLFAKLCKDNHLHLHRKKLGLLNMGGINLGPFIGLDSKLVIRAFSQLENEIIRELFEYQKQNSELSLQLNESFKVLMQNNVKVTFTGVPNDQFVPLSSSLAVHYNHPNIHRNLYQPQETEGVATGVSDLSSAPFITNLLIVICTMRNLGHDIDYNLIRELSDRIMNDTTTKGHCKVFNDEQVYLEAIRHTLETTNLIHSHDLKVYHLKPLDGSFYNLLAWNIRSLFQDLINIHHIKSGELIRELLVRFQNWNPTSKQWKEFKYCLDVLNEFEIEDLFL